jgi:hypothetical protein
MQLVVEFIDAVWNDGDIDAAAKYVADSYTIHHDPGDPWEGRRLTLAEFQDRVRTYRKPFPDQRFTVHEILVSDARVMMAWLWNATRSGEPVAASGATVYYLEGDKLCGHWQVTARPAPAQP